MLCYAWWLNTGAIATVLCYFLYPVVCICIWNCQITVIIPNIDLVCFAGSSVLHELEVGGDCFTQYPFTYFLLSIPWPTSQAKMQEIYPLWFNISYSKSGKNKSNKHSSQGFGLYIEKTHFKRQKLPLRCINACSLNRPNSELEKEENEDISVCQRKTGRKCCWNRKLFFLRRYVSV